MTLTGTYTLQDDIVTLRTAFGNKTAQLLGSNIATTDFVLLELFTAAAPPLLVASPGAAVQRRVRALSPCARSGLVFNERFYQMGAAADDL